MNTNPAMDERTYHGYRDDQGTCHVQVAELGDLAGTRSAAETRSVCRCCGLGGKRAAFSHAGCALSPRLNLANKSPTGFEWGYGGSGPAQLALALCADALGDDEAALDLFQLFKDRVISALPRDEPWTLTAAEVRRHCRELQA